MADEDLLADDELYKTVELGWQVMLARFAIWDLKSRGNASNADTTASLFSILHRLLGLREVRAVLRSFSNSWFLISHFQKYCDVLHAADEAPKGQWTPNLEVLSRFAAFYWANILFYHRMLNDHYPSVTPQYDLHREAISKLVMLLYYRYNQDKNLRKQSRVVWCYFMAATETQDPVHRDWLAERLAEVRDVSVECKHLWTTASAILGQA